MRKYSILVLFGLLIFSNHSFACSLAVDRMDCPAGSLFSTFTCKCENKGSEFYPKHMEEVNKPHDENKLIAPKTDYKKLDDKSSKLVPRNIK